MRDLKPVQISGDSEVLYPLYPLTHLTVGW
jgi:hypothetical protein